MSPPMPIAVRCESQTLTTATRRRPPDALQRRTPAAAGSRSAIRADTFGSRAPVSASSSWAASAAVAGPPRRSSGLGSTPSTATGSSSLPPEPVASRGPQPAATTARAHARRISRRIPPRVASGGGLARRASSEGVRRVCRERAEGDAEKGTATRRGCSGLLAGRRQRANPGPGRALICIGGTGPSAGVRGHRPCRPDRAAPSASPTRAAFGAKPGPCRRHLTKARQGPLGAWRPARAKAGRTR